jgi:hypothetical protein
MSNNQYAKKTYNTGFSISLKAKHLTASVRIKIARQGHGMSQNIFESLTIRWVNIGS